MNFEKQLEKFVDKMKEPLQKYWVNEVKLPLPIQLHSFALMDLYVKDRFRELDDAFSHFREFSDLEKALLFKSLIADSNQENLVNMRDFIDNLLKTLW